MTRRAPKNVQIPVRVSVRQKKEYEDRAYKLGTTLSALACEGMGGSPIADLALFRTALRQVVDPPVEAWVAWTALTSSFATIGDVAWPEVREARMLKVWADWAAGELERLAKEG